MRWKEVAQQSTYSTPFICKIMAEAVMGFTIAKPHIHCSYLLTTTRRFEAHPFSRLHSNCPVFKGTRQAEEGKSRRGSLCKVNGFPDWPLMAVIVEQYGGKEVITSKYVMHLSDQGIKNVYSWYIMFTVWGCLFFGSMKDPYYDSEAYRGDGGDGTGNWIYEKQDEMEAAAREALWREELIEEIEQKVGGLKELEEAGKKEELVK